MYTGIVQDKVEVRHVEIKPGLHTLVLDFSPSLRQGLTIGASVALDGVCFTVTKIDGSLVSFDAMQETLAKTTIGLLRAGSLVNVERSAKAGDEIGGHVVSGHIHDRATITHIATTENNHVLTFQVGLQWMKYIFSKGFLAINGCSLTVTDADRGRGTFTVWLIPETLRKTTFGTLNVDDQVNIEIETQTQIIVDTIENIVDLKISERLDARITHLIDQKIH